MSTERYSRMAFSDLHERRRSRSAGTVALHTIAAVFLVAALALMAQWLISDPVGGPWLLAGLLTVCGVTSLVASVRDAQVDDDPGVAAHAPVE